MKFNGIEVSDTVFEVIPWDMVRLTIRWVLDEYKLPEDAFTGLVLKTRKKHRAQLAHYSYNGVGKREIVMYRENFKYAGPMTAVGVLVHELVHAVQHRHAGYDITFSAVRPAFKALTLYPGEKSKYFSQDIEIEAYSVQHKFLAQFQATGVMSYYIHCYKNLGVDIGNIAL